MSANILRSLTSGGGDQEQGVLEETCSAFSLTKTQRLYGFGICFCVGFLMSIMGSIFLFLANIVAFAILYTLGNLISLMSTGFLIGPWRQCKNMFDPIRIWATIVFFVTMILTLIIAFTLRSPANGFVIIFVVIQFMALVWYSASYVPYGRALIQKFLSRLCG